MGRGNYCPVGKLTDQWYIDFEKYKYDETEEYDLDACLEDINFVMGKIKERFPSFESCDEYSKTEHGRYWGEQILLRNSFFEIGIADNTWSLAIFIKERDDLEVSGITERHFKGYCLGIKDILLDFYGEIELRNGPWMSSVLRKEAMNV